MDSEAASDQPGTERQRREFHLAELSNAMVRLYKDIFGRGPTKTRTNYAGPDVIVSTLEDSLTRPERRMAEAGEHERLRNLRMFLQYEYQDDFVGAVEAITGRRVTAFISGLDTRRDIACELFYLEPDGTGANR